MVCIYCVSLLIIEKYIKNENWYFERIVKTIVIFLCLFFRSLKGRPECTASPAPLHRA